MKLYQSGVAIPVHYPAGSTTSQTLATELAARLDELMVAPTTTFSSQVFAGLPTVATRAIFVGVASEWPAPGVPWWNDTLDLGIRVVSGSDRLNPLGMRRELHVIARDELLLLRAIWILLHELGWRHYMPNGVPGHEERWIVRKQVETLRTRIDRVWAGAIDHLQPSIAGGTTAMNHSDGTNHFDPVNFPGGLQEGNLAGALGGRPLVDGPGDGWLRHMGWTSSTLLQTNAAWGLLKNHGIQHFGFTEWAGTPGSGVYTDGDKLYTDSQIVRDAAVDYANQKAALAHWVSLARPDGEAGWDVDFGDPAFGARPPVTRQIEIANYVAGRFTGQGIVIHTYGRCAEPPGAVLPDPARVCALIVEAYRPAGRSVETIIGDYIDAAGDAVCPLGLYQHLYTAAWGRGSITAPVGSPTLLVEAANRALRLPATRPSVVGGEAMTEFGLYGLGYYCYMRMLLEVGERTTDFTEADYDAHKRRFFRDLFPTRDVRRAVRRWYRLLTDVRHAPLLHAHLLHGLWEALEDAMAASTPGDAEQLRIVELACFTRWLDLRNAYEAAKAAGAPVETAYDAMLEWVFRLRDSGLVDARALFEVPLDPDAHAALGHGTIFTALKSPPPAWDTSFPPPSLFDDPATSLIAQGLANNQPHGLDDVVFSESLVGGWNRSDPRPRMPSVAFLPYRAKGKTHIWLVPGGATFDSSYRLAVGGGEAFAEIVEHATGSVAASFVLAEGTTAVRTAVTPGLQYEIRLTTYATSAQVYLDWWSAGGPQHFVSFDPGREGDPSGIGGVLLRSFYFLVPDGVSEIHFFAESVEDMALYTLDATGAEVQDATFQPRPRDYQSHPVPGSGRRVLRIAGLCVNELGFWLLNCPNLFALHPQELLRPVDA